MNSTKYTNGQLKSQQKQDPNNSWIIFYYKENFREKFNNIVPGAPRDGGDLHGGKRTRGLKTKREVFC